MAQSHRVEQLRAFFAAGFEVDGDAEGRADLVLAGVAAADGGCFVGEQQASLLLLPFCVFNHGSFC